MSLMRDGHLYNCYIATLCYKFHPNEYHSYMLLSTYSLNCDKSIGCVIV